MCCLYANTTAMNIADIVKNRFIANMHRHLELDWLEVEQKLSSKILDVLRSMEETGGEPDVVKLSNEDSWYFVDCSKESPLGRRSMCYDKVAMDSRKNHKPNGNVIELAQAIGAELLTENDYETLQSLEKFDLKSSSWVYTPDSIRKLGGALFCDRRYDTVFTYHNGAESYYSARGFRLKIKI